MLIPHSRPIIIISLLLLVLIGGGIGCYWYLNVELEKMVESVRGIAALRTDSNKEAAILATAAETATLRSEIGKYFVTPQTVAQFLEQVEGVAKTSEVTLTLNQAVAKEALYLELYAEGDFSNLMNFLERLENLPFHLQINQAQIAANKSEVAERATQWSLAATLTLISYEQ